MKRLERLIRQALNEGLTPELVKEIREGCPWEIEEGSPFDDCHLDFRVQVDDQSEDGGAGIIDATFHFDNLLHVRHLIRLIAEARPKFEGWLTIKITAEGYTWVPESPWKWLEEDKKYSSKEEDM